MPYQGSCLCGQVTIDLGVTLDSQYVCYCTDCRQTSGSAMSSNIFIPKSKIKIMGPTKQYSSPAATGNIVTRIFCSNCGSAISHTTTLAPTLQAIQTGNLADFAKIPIKYELFVKDRWTGLAPIAGAEQFDAMPGMEFIQKSLDLENNPHV